MERTTAKPPVKPELEPEPEPEPEQQEEQGEDVVDIESLSKIAEEQALQLQGEFDQVAHLLSEAERVELQKDLLQLQRH